MFPMCPFEAVKTKEVEGVCRVVTFADDGRPSKRFLRSEAFSDDEEIGTVNLAFFESNMSFPFC